MSPTSKDERLKIFEKNLQIKEEKITEIRDELRVETDEKQIRKMNNRIEIEERSRKLIADEIERIKASIHEGPRNTNIEG